MSVNRQTADASASHLATASHEDAVSPVQGETTNNAPHAPSHSPPPAPQDEIWDVDQSQDALARFNEKYDSFEEKQLREACRRRNVASAITTDATTPRRRRVDEANGDGKERTTPSGVRRRTPSAAAMMNRVPHHEHPPQEQRYGFTGAAREAMCDRRQGSHARPGSDGRAVPSPLLAQDVNPFNGQDREVDAAYRRLARRMRRRQRLLDEILEKRRIDRREVHVFYAEKYASPAPSGFMGFGVPLMIHGLIFMQLYPKNTLAVAVTLVSGGILQMVCGILCFIKKPPRYSSVLEQVTFLTVGALWFAEALNDLLPVVDWPGFAHAVNTTATLSSSPFLPSSLAIHVASGTDRRGVSGGDGGNVGDALGPSPHVISEVVHTTPSFYAIAQMLFSLFFLCLAACATQRYLIMFLMYSCASLAYLLIAAGAWSSSERVIATGGGFSVATGACAVYMTFALHINECHSKHLLPLFSMRKTVRPFLRGLVVGVQQGLLSRGGDTPFFSTSSGSAEGSAVRAAGRDVNVREKREREADLQRNAAATTTTATATT